MIGEATSLNAFTITENGCYSDLVRNMLKTIYYVACTNEKTKGEGIVCIIQKMILQTSLQSPSRMKCQRNIGQNIKRKKGVA